jgi:hypothetical protein
MNATKILWGQVFLVSFVLLAFLWGRRSGLPGAWRSNPSSAARGSRFLAGRCIHRQLSSGGGSPTTPMHARFSSKAPISRLPMVSPPSSWRSLCRCGAHGRSNASPPMARRAGPSRAKFATPRYSTTTACCWANGAIIIFVMTAPSTSCVPRPLDPGKASVSSSPRF